MKKKDLYLVFGIIILVIVGFFISREAGSNKVSEEQIKEWKNIIASKELNSGLNEVEYSYVDALFNVSEEPRVIVISRTGCSYCVKYKPIIEEAAKENGVSVILIETDNISSNDSTKLNKIVSEYFSGTPTTLLMKGKTVIDSISGYVEKSAVVSFFTKNNLIK